MSRPLSLLPMLTVAAYCVCRCLIAILLGKVILERRRSISLYYCSQVRGKFLFVWVSLVRIEAKLRTGTFHESVTHLARCDRRREKQSYFVDTLNFVEAERAAGKAIYPPAKDVFNAFRFTEFNDVKVVILGQDPYHGPNQAHGLCFSVLPGIKTPPSLVNMYKELAQDIEGFQILSMDSCKVGRARRIVAQYGFDG